MSKILEVTSKSSIESIHKRFPISPVIRKFSRPILFKDCKPNEKTYSAISKQLENNNSFKISYFSIPPIKASPKYSKSPELKKLTNILTPDLKKRQNSNLVPINLRKNLTKFNFNNKTIKPKYLKLEI